MDRCFGGSLVSPKSRNVTVPTLLCLLVFLVPYIAHGASVTLQQDVDGYAGCTDSYIGNGGYADDSSANFGTSPTLILNSEHYNPG